MIGELNNIQTFMRNNVDLALDMPYIQERNLSLPIEERKLLLEKMIVKQKRLIELMVLCEYRETSVGIEKGALKVLENFVENL